MITASCRPIVLEIRRFRLESNSAWNQKNWYYESEDIKFYMESKKLKIV
jgi:hypothetical protein